MTVNSSFVVAKGRVILVAADPAPSTLRRCSRVINSVSSNGSQSQYFRDNGLLVRSEIEDELLFGSRFRLFSPGFVHSSTNSSC